MNRQTNKHIDRKKIIPALFSKLEQAASVFDILVMGSTDCQ